MVESVKAVEMRLQAKISALEAQLDAASSFAERQHAELESLRERSRDFPFEMYDEGTETGMARVVKVECPGVTHSDVEIEIIFNGAVIMIDRRPAQGFPASRWTRRLQFGIEEGRFEFAEDETKLEFGILQVTFKTEIPTPRIFRFPQHSDLATSVSSWAFAIPAIASYPASDESHEPNGPESPTAKASAEVWGNPVAIDAAVLTMAAPGAYAGVSEPSEILQIDECGVASSPARVTMALSSLPTESSAPCTASSGHSSGRSSGCSRDRGGASRDVAE